MKATFRYTLIIAISLWFVGEYFKTHFGAKAIPGGPFVSFRGDVLPHIFAGIAILLIVWRYSSYSSGKKTTALFVVAFALLLSISTAHATYSFFHDPFARGVFFRW
jgi:hypothetical protein